MSSKITRIAIVNEDKCRPQRCAQECKKSCPVVKMGKLCIEVKPTDRIVTLSEALCIGCGICVKKCPFEALQIINLPTNLSTEVSHRYSANSFKLHRLPIPRAGQVLGLVGTNGIGKSTALKILAGNVKPNLGRYDDPPDWQEILKHYRGSGLQNYFAKIVENNLKTIIKPQYVDHLPRTVKGKVSELLDSKLERDNKEELCNLLQLDEVLDRQIDQLSGGELQRFAIAMTCIRKADVYMFDEPSSYLDIKQRLQAARVIRRLLKPDTYVICVEHDLSVLDFLSDFVCCLYGQPSVYGVVTMPFAVREGINIFLDGFIRTANLRFREVSLDFKMVKTADERGGGDKTRQYSYPAMSKTLGRFKLTVDPGEFSDSEIIVMLGENGTGKTTFIRLLAGHEIPDSDSDSDVDFDKDTWAFSLKPQTLSPRVGGTVRTLLLTHIRAAFMQPQFQTDVVKPMNLDNIIDQDVRTLSGGELQRVAIVLCLGKPGVDLYLIDEPSSFLDSEQRIVASKVIKRFVMHAKKTAFVIEHDFIMATYLADRVMVFEGTPAVRARATPPQSLLTGMNKFLASLEITFRRDPTNYRPRVNKFGGLRDREQKAAGNYFFLEDC